ADGGAPPWAMGAACGWRALCSVWLWPASAPERCAVHRAASPPPPPPRWGEGCRGSGLVHGSAPSARTDSLSPGGRGLGRGGGNRRTTHRLKYHRQHLFSIEQYLVIPEPQYPKALTSEPLVALHIPGTGVVLAAIGLHNQPRTEVHEIHHIAAQRLLTAKFLTR